MLEQRGIETPRIAAAGEPHLACVLLLDTSGSMAGNPIRSLNQALNDFKEKISLDELAQKRVDVAIISFDDEARIEQDFTPISEMKSISLSAGGCTSMGAAINLAIDKVKERNRFYAELGTPCFKPWIFMITDGASTDDVSEAAARVRLEESKGSHGKLKFFALGVDGYDREELFKITDRVMELSGTDFTGIFNWLSESMVAISVSRIGDTVQAQPLPSNVTIPPNDWMN